MTVATLRPAVVADAADIHALLLKVAGEIPLMIETLEQEEALYGALRKILAFGQSWVALDGETIAGVALVDSAEVGRHWGEGELLNLRYAAGDMLDELVGKVVERNAPITASVRDTNRTGLGQRLLRFGFRETATRVGERHFRREP